jgi:tungstate transport system permease protein
MDGGPALGFLPNFDGRFFDIVRLSLIVSCSATALAGLIGLPLGAALALLRFPGRWGIVVILNAFMGLPPVVVGLVAYLLLSRSGPLGFLGLLFTPLAMIVAQSMLVLPIIASLARQTIEDLWGEYRNELTALRIPALQRVRTLLFEARLSLVTVLLAGFGRAAAEVGHDRGRQYRRLHAHHDHGDCARDFQGRPAACHRAWPPACDDHHLGQRSRLDCPSGQRDPGGLARRGRSSFSARNIGYSPA